MIWRPYIGNVEVMTYVQTNRISSYRLDPSGRRGRVKILNFTIVNDPLEGQGGQKNVGNKERFILEVRGGGVWPNCQKFPLFGTFSLNTWLMHRSTTVCSLQKYNMHLNSSNALKSSNCQYFPTKNLHWIFQQENNESSRNRCSGIKEYSPLDKSGHTINIKIHSTKRTPCVN